MKHEHGKWFCGRKFSPLAIAGMVVGGLALAVVFAFLFGWAVMLLWNWLMPEIFGLPRISYWQGWGLVLLAHILVKGGWGSHGGNDHDECHERHGKSGTGETRNYDASETGGAWCESCETCDYTESCRPFAHGWIRTADGWIRTADGWIRTADGWKQDSSGVKKDISDRIKEKQ